MKSRKKGITLVEVLLATFLFTVAMLALLGSLAASLDLITVSREETIAVGDLRNVLEEIRSTAYSQMLTLFPDGVIDGPAANNYSSLVGGYKLIEEHITVSYPNPGADPLEIEVGITWQDKAGRGFNASASTFKTR